MGVKFSSSVFEFEKITLIMVDCMDSTFPKALNTRRYLIIYEDTGRYSR